MDADSAALAFPISNGKKNARPPARGSSPKNKGIKTDK
jgi:hypothetical protein